MKGVILAGGLGTRLYPLTKITNKHLLPVYDKPMIYYPLLTLVKAGIEDIMIITGGNNAGDFLRLLGNGNAFGLKNLQYSYQERERGIAHALKLAEHFVENDLCMVILGDNIVEDDLTPAVKEFEKKGEGAKIFLKEVENPCDYGVAVMEDNKIIKIIEKPESPPTNYAITGIYMYDSKVFQFIDSLKPSRRGEYEITDVNNLYIERGELEYEVLDGWWGDAGASIDALLETNIYVAEKIKRNPEHWWNFHQKNNGD